MTTIYDGESDVNGSRVEVVMVCPGCGNRTRGEVFAETLATLACNEDGSYNEPEQCYECEIITPGQGKEQ